MSTKYIIIQQTQKVTQSDNITSSFTIYFGLNLCQSTIVKSPLLFGTFVMTY
mgnify:CR=1 FL=1